MTKPNGPFRRMMAGAALGASVLAMAGTAGGGANAGWFSSDQVRCEIKVTPSPYGVELEGLVFAENTLAGEYELSVTQDGLGSHSLINQSGPFEAAPESPARLGRVTVGGGNGATYTAKLKVYAGGETFTCAQRVGGQA